jgi:hypothetical protein
MTAFSINGKPVAGKLIAYLPDVRLILKALHELLVVPVVIRRIFCYKLRKLLRSTGIASIMSAPNRRLIRILADDIQPRRCRNPSPAR